MRIITAAGTEGNVIDVQAEHVGDIVVADGHVTVAGVAAQVNRVLGHRTASHGLVQHLSEARGVGVAGRGNVHSEVLGSP